MCHETSRAKRSFSHEGSGLGSFGFRSQAIVTQPSAIQTSIPRNKYAGTAVCWAWTRVWLNRSRMRRDLMDLALRQPDSVLDDAGLTRQVALREASKWFWLPPKL